MQSQIISTGVAGSKFSQALGAALEETRPTVIGLAVAYVSKGGFDSILRQINAVDVQAVRLVTDIRDGVTHPTALSAALQNNWETRVVNRPVGTFHSKLWVGGMGFDEHAGITGLSLSVVGSANVSLAALEANIECSFIKIGNAPELSSERAWTQCWEIGEPLTKEILDEYEKTFAERNKSRSAADLVLLGVADGSAFDISTTASTSPRRSPPDDLRAIRTDSATTAWAGLQSFTGDYDLQVEFPRDAGNVLASLLGQMSASEVVDVLCDDFQSRQFTYRYYPQNGMWRLNIPNSTPGVDRVRDQRDGIAVMRISDGRARFSILEPGQIADEVIRHSEALGTWGATSTRFYGWF